MDVRLKPASCLIISASSQSGKTYLAEHLITGHKTLFTQPFEEVCWVYHPSAANEVLFERIKKSLDIPVSFVSGYPYEQLENETLFNVSRGNHTCLVIDD